MGVLITGNNCYSTLAGSLTDVGTNLTMATGEGARFPEVTGGDYAYLWFEDASNNRECVKVTAHTSGTDSFTIVRGQKSTTARAWSAGDVVELRPTAEEFADAYNHIADSAAAHAASAISYSGDSTWTTAPTEVDGALDLLNTIKAPAAGSTAITTLGAVASGTWTASPITRLYGGTGQTAFASGDLLYAQDSTSSTLAKLAKGSARQALLMDSSAGFPSWGSSPQSLMTAAGDILYASAANVPARLAKGTASYTLRMDSSGAFPAWREADVTLGANTFTGAQAFGNNTLSGIKTAGFHAEYDNGNSGTAKTVTLANGQKQKLTLTGNATITVDFTGATVGNYQLRLIQDGTGSRTVAWSGLTSTRWLGSATPPSVNSAAAGETIVSIFYDGASAVQSLARVGAA